MRICLKISILQTLGKMIKRSRFQRNEKRSLNNLYLESGNVTPTVVKSITVETTELIMTRVTEWRGIKYRG